MSQRPAVRSGIRASKPVFLIWSWSPNALATARAPSTSKPTAWFGSVTLAEEKNSMGEYSMSTQSVSVPDLIRLVGGVTDTFDEDRKSTRLNSSHTVISYAVFCLKKKK